MALGGSRAESTATFGSPEVPCESLLIAFGTAEAIVGKQRGKPLWSSWSEQFEVGCSFNPEEADNAEEQWAEAEAASQELQLNIELLKELRAEASEKDQYEAVWDFWKRVLRHIETIPNERWKQAVQCWVLRDFDVSPTFRNGFIVGETLREAGERLLEVGVAVREKDGSLSERSDGYLPGQIYPFGVQELIEHGLGFCLATELWLNNTALPEVGAVRELDWDSLIEKCEQWVKDELRVRNRYTKA